MSNNQVSKVEQGAEKFFFRASSESFSKVPGAPIAYWTTDPFRATYNSSELLGSAVRICAGLQTGDNNRFLRFWHETALEKQNLANGSRDSGKWFPYNKGGELRKWYGNRDYVVNWESEGKEIYEFRPRSVLRNPDFYFLEGITWSDITTRSFAARYTPSGCLFDVKGSSAFPSADKLGLVLALMNSCLTNKYMHVLNPTVTFQVGDISRIPLRYVASVDGKVKKLIEFAKNDWDSYETSWDFTSLPLLHHDHRQPTLKASYQSLRTHWLEMTLEMKSLEEENNRIFIDAYGLHDELDEKVDISEITLTCNPHYRYGGDKSVEELEAQLLADTMRELVSYGVGCMFGRYSLDKPGLILANQGETLMDYLAKVPQPSFPAEDDTVIPLLDGDWFPDDITLRFRQFLRVAFGDVSYEDNLAFIEQALNVKGKRNYSLRDYFLGEFYADHVKRYKKRPIYWLFSSPKGTFSALVYLHRYRPDTVSVVLNYLRDFRKKLTSRLDYLQQVAISTSVSQSEKTKANKEAEIIKKQLIELDDYERDTLYPLATEQVELYLDDGVKFNYLKLGAALKKIVGLDAKAED
ncbi:BREX-1 system adenine-specific DNA-methyltransferase PglX [Pseudomonas putida]|uniref:BREX-1 system adenine-specific DNA-methyltransferase PglX n=1 Tax=Pseudomonas putida TaxID=303 RepID=UPI001F1C5F3B|nr:BREX-1 system adenine-specific DNA-methyltransferase PglX [Pseudomonas putida]MDP9540590.1 BREX-1 system adenine-specific DNA-methyltransferase PglX [Pseudomonas putida]